MKHTVDRWIERERERERERRTIAQGFELFQKGQILKNICRKKTKKLKHFAVLRNLHEFTKKCLLRYYFL